MRAVHAGPGTNLHQAKKDIGKTAPAAQNTGGFRAAGSATGPSSSQANYVATQDIGKQAPAAAADGFRMTGTASGPSSSQGTYTATQDIGKQMPAAGDPYWAAGNQHSE